MRRILTLTILIILSFVLQTTLFTLHDLSGTAPNLLLILTMSFGIMRGRKEGMLTGFFSGLLYDLFYGSLVGPYAFFYMLIGYMNGMFHKKYLMEDISLPVLIIAFDQLVFDLVIYIIGFVLRNRANLGYFLIHRMLPQILYDVLITVIVYRLLLRINRGLKKRSNKKLSAERRGN